MTPQQSSEPGPGDFAERRRTSPAKRVVRETLLDELKNDLSARLRPICGHMSDEEFERMVLDMARMRMRFWDLEQNEELQGSYDPAEEDDDAR